MSVYLPSRLSYSALSSYSECGERFRLERLHKLESSTWLATLAGKAVHDITEALDRRLLGEDVPVPDWTERFDYYVREAIEQGIEVKVSGKYLKEMAETGGPNKKDRDWWAVYGPKYIERWVEWRDARLAEGWSFATMPDGSVGIEVAFEVEIAGERTVGYIDRVFINHLGQVEIVDLKSGNIPTSKLQLGVYGEGLRQEWGIEPEWGSYWMGSKGDTLPRADLAWYSSEYVQAQFDMAWKGIKAGVFLASPSSLCKPCPVNEFCRSYGGMRSTDIPITDVILPSRGGGSAPR